MKYYTILAGRKEPAKVLQGTLNKTTGLPDANAQKVSIVVGSIIIPNYSRPWARRIITGGTKVGEDYVGVTHKEYRGELEFMPYGAEGGEEMDIRFLKNSNTLDKLYQDTVQKLQPAQEDAVIVLQQGINNFDPKTEKLRIEMLRHHGLNRDNTSRNPQNIDYDIVEYNSSSHKKDKVTQMNIDNAANQYILDAQHDRSRLQILAGIFRLDPMLQDDDIIEALIDRKGSSTNDFLKAITNYQHDISIMLHDAVKDEMIKISKDGKFTMVTDKGNVPIFQNVQGEGRDKIAWLIQQALVDAAIYEGLKQVDKNLTELRKQVV